VLSIAVEYLYRFISRYDAQNCEELVRDKLQTHNQAMQEQGKQLSTQTAKAVHLEQTVKKLESEKSKLSKQLHGSENEVEKRGAEVKRLQSQLKEALRLQNELIQRMEANEAAYDQAKKLEEMFKTVQSEYSAASKIVREFQESTTNGSDVTPEAA